MIGCVPSPDPARRGAGTAGGGVAELITPRLQRITGSGQGRFDCFTGGGTVV